MSGIDEARAMSEKIKEESLKEKINDSTIVPIRVESSKDMAPVKPNLNIVGLEEVPVSMIPLPFYRLVQPGSTNIALADGKDAVPGTFFMSDSGKAVESINFALLRAKRMHRNFVNSEGENVHSTTMAMVGINLENMSPFMMNVSVASFSNFGRMLSQMREKAIQKAWQYPVIMTTEKREEVKETLRGSQRVKYWIINFSVGSSPVDEVALEGLNKAYEELAASLDRNIEDEPKTEPTPF